MSWIEPQRMSWLEHQRMSWLEPQRRDWLEPQRMGWLEPQNENENINPNGIIILGVYIHCEGCANEVKRCILGFQGVEGVEIDTKDHRVIVKGEKADPIKITERLSKKSGKYVELISPKPPKKEDIKKEKPQEEVSEVLLRIYLHCDGCAKEVKHCIFNMEGVQTVETNAAKNRVIVKGSMDPKKLVELINERGGRHAHIIKQTNLNTINYSYQYDICHDNARHLVFAPQLFSDENPNSCSLM